MLKQQILRNFFILSLSALASCVSVNISGGKPTSAKDVMYSSPSRPFEEIKLKDADHAWQNKDNGNTISYLSTCNDPADPSLASARADFLASLSNLKIENENESTFNGREALTTVAEGSLDGVKTRLELLLFKKNNCLYTVSYVAVAKSFDQNHEAFNSFLQNFRAP